MGRRYRLGVAALAGAFIAADMVSAGSGGTTAPFFQRQLCGPLWAWLIAFIVPAETIQTRLSDVVSRAGRSDRG